MQHYLLQEGYIPGYICLSVFKITTKLMKASLRMFICGYGLTKVRQDFEEDPDHKLDTKKFTVLNCHI